METTELVVGKVYSFTLYPERIYGTNIKDATFIGRVHADMVSAFGIVASEEHKLAYSSLPNGVPNDAYQYSWLAFTTVAGNRLIIGEPWVVAGSVLGGADVDIWSISGISGDSTTPAKIKSALNAIGIYDFTVSKS